MGGPLVSHTSSRRRLRQLTSVALATCERCGGRGGAVGASEAAGAWRVRGGGGGERVGGRAREGPGVG